MKKRLPGFVFLFIGSIFPLVGGFVAEDQRRKFDHWIEVPAEIIGQEVNFHTDSDGDPMYGPVLKLRYLADGMPETGDGLFAIDTMSSEEWAKDQLAAWPVGKRVTAWADPEHLEKAYVVREVSVLPYVIMLAPMVFVSFGAMFVLFPGGEGKVYTPGTPWAGRTFVIVWNTVGIACAVHYFTQPGAWNAAGIALFSIYLGIGFVPVVVMVKRAIRG
ncbi:MAG: DUF3592 domain-containing protein [Planctomycetes bacterium]|nr:DUF3592 domain-containing protein [Planctomycetota bacterium]